MSKNCLSSAAFALIAASHYDETRYQILFQAPCISPVCGFSYPQTSPISQLRLNLSHLRLENTDGDLLRKEKTRWNSKKWQ